MLSAYWKQLDNFLISREKDHLNLPQNRTGAEAPPAVV